MRPDTPATMALRMLVRARADLVTHRIGVHNQLLADLQHHFPGAIGLFSAAAGRTGTLAAEAGQQIVLTRVALLSQLRETAELEARIREALLAHPDGPIFTSLPRVGTIRGRPTAPPNTVDSTSCRPQG